MVNIITPSHHSHSAVALWLGNMLVIVENNPQAPSMMRLSQYWERAEFVDITCCPFPNAAESVLSKTIFHSMKTKIKYSYWQLVVAAVMRMTGVGLPYTKTRQICSEFILGIYQELGMIRTGNGIVDPSKLVELTEMYYTRNSLTDLRKTDET